MSEQKNMGYSTCKFDSYDELRDGIEMGLDVEFFLYNVRYDISWENDNCVFIAVCPDGDASYYKDADDLLNNHKINGVPIGKLWKDIDLYRM